MTAKKAFLKSFAIFMAVCMVFGMIGAASAEEVAFNHGQKEVVVAGVVDSQKAQLIASVISGEPIVSSMANILCVFGHSKATGKAIETLHCQYASVPRCVRNSYDVTYCTRSGCDYIAYTLTSSGRIYCCS